jgi:hypothetical protein
MTETELQAQQQHDETMRRLRARFAQAWPEIWRRVEATNPATLMPPVHQAAWLAFVKGSQHAQTSPSA